MKSICFNKIILGNFEIFNFGMKKILLNGLVKGNGV